VCASARDLSDTTTGALRAWFEGNFRPWALVNPDGSRNGLITGYYEPILKGSRQRGKTYSQFPVFGPPEDLIVVELAELYPELKHLRLRGRLEGRKLIPYYSRAEWAPQESKRSPEALLFIDDAIDLFFMQIQGSGQIQLADGSRVRLNYADQNGHPYRSIGRWLVDQGEMKAEQASMQNIKAWAKANPKRLSEMLNANPSLVFFRELPVEGSGPQGAMGLP
jgi:membrane-bound lytic murein transglycosylase A